jgi:hypothetical protein
MDSRRTEQNEYVHRLKIKYLDGHDDRGKKRAQYEPMNGSRCKYLEM